VNQVFSRRSCSVTRNRPCGRFHSASGMVKHPGSSKSSRVDREFRVRAPAASHRESHSAPGDCPAGRAESLPIKRNFAKRQSTDSMVRIGRQRISVPHALATAGEWILQTARRHPVHNQLAQVLRAANSAGNFFVPWKIVVVPDVESVFPFILGYRKPGLAFVLPVFANGTEVWA
jgi:hypothetical protein